MSTPPYQPEFEEVGANYSTQDQQQNNQHIEPHPIRSFEQHKFQEEFPHTEVSK